MDVRVRFPPSPTGIPHVGNTRTALFNFLFARHNNGKFILRIEDTDRARLVEGAEDAIREILTWLEISWDEFYKQSERLDLYKDAVDVLLQKGLARRDEGAVRFIIPKGKEISWTDQVGEKKISFKSETIEDFVILKSDGYPTYHLANVVDDHEMKISHVIRGDEWISSTPKHILLYEAFGWEYPTFVHLPVILGPDRTKLSKRHGAESALDLRSKGFLKEAIINFMALLGWNPGGDREIMSIGEMIKLFDLTDINTGSPIFDIKKLLWMNGEYIRKSQISNLKSQILEFDPDLSKIPNFEKYIPLAQDRMKTLADFKDLIEKKSGKKVDESIRNDIRREFESYKENTWTKEKIFESLKIIMAKHNIKMPVLYGVFTGRDSGLPLADFLEILGKDQALARIER